MGDIMFGCELECTGVWRLCAQNDAVSAVVWRDGCEWIGIRDSGLGVMKGMGALPG